MNTQNPKIEIMKKTLFLILALMTFGLTNTSFGQQLKNKEIIFTLPAHETETIVPIEGMDFTLKFTHKDGAVREFEGSECSPEAFNGLVRTHPAGPFHLSIKYLDQGSTAQENRRVEIKIVFN